MRRAPRSATQIPTPQTTINGSGHDGNKVSKLFRCEGKKTNAANIKKPRQKSSSKITGFGICFVHPSSCLRRRGWQILLKLLVAGNTAKDYLLEHHFSVGLTPKSLVVSANVDGFRYSARFAMCWILLSPTLLMSGSLLSAFSTDLFTLSMFFPSFSFC
jgi:hypothetical protein